MDLNIKWYKSDEAKKFLESSAYKQRLYDVAYGMAGKPIKLVFYSGSDVLGYSDGDTINVNLFPALFKESTLRELYVYHIALIVHEYSHNLYTAFRFVREAMGRSNSVMLLKDIFNLIEDARIERISSYKLPGYANALYVLNLAIYNIQGDQPINDDLTLLRAALWNYALLGINATDLPKHLQEDWEAIRKLARSARLENECEPCFYAAKAIVAILKKYLKSTYSVMVSGLVNYEGTGHGRKADVDEDNDSQSCSGSSAEEGNSSANAESASEDCDSSGDPIAVNGDPKSGGAAEQISQLEERAKEFLSDSEEDLSLTQSTYENDVENEAFDNDLMRQCGSENRGVSVKHPRFDYQCVDIYNNLKAKNAAIISNMQRKLVNVIRFNDDEKSHRQSRGKVDGKSLCNVINGRICSTYKEKSEETDLNITFLLDKSGSMSGTRAVLTLETSIILSESLETLKIPYSVLSFGSDVSIYKHWRQKSRHSKYGIINYTIDGSTMLTEALEVVKKSFIGKQNNLDKIVFVITDGFPDNFQTAAEMIKKLKKDAQIYGIGIGNLEDEERSFISLFGKDYYIYVKDLNDLPRAITNLIKKNLLRKE